MWSWTFNCCGSCNLIPIFTKSFSFEDLLNFRAWEYLPIMVNCLTWRRTWPEECYRHLTLQQVSSAYSVLGLGVMSNCFHSKFLVIPENSYSFLAFWIIFVHVISVLFSFLLNYYWWGRFLDQGNIQISW